MAVPPGRDQERDRDLVAAALGGEAWAYASIFDRYGPRLLVFCERALGDGHTAADATQETFVVAAQRLGQLRDPDRLAPWLYAIARNECTRAGRARDRARPVEADVMDRHDQLVDHAADPAQHAETAERNLLLWQAADGLEASDRLLLDLLLRHGLEGEDLAVAAGIGPGQISMAVGRMKDRLERSIGALLIARHGDRDCPELAQALAGWDGRYQVLVRKRVARHVDRCERCADRRTALVAPLGSFALAPALVAFGPEVLPDGLRARTVARMADAGSGGGAHAGANADADADVDADPGRAVAQLPAPDPEPRPAPALDRDPERTAALPAQLAATTGVAGDAVGDEAQPEAGRRRAVAVGVLAVVLAALVAMAWQPWSAPADDGPVAIDLVPGPMAGGPLAGGPTTSPPDATVVSTTLVAASTTSTVPPDAVPTSTSVPEGPVTRPPESQAPPAAVPTAPAPGPAPPGPTPAPTPPNQPPTLGAVTRSGSTTLQTTCNPANATRTVTVPASDDQGAPAVTLSWTHATLGSGQATMEAIGGGRYRATLGPFADPGEVVYRVRASDGSSSTTSAAQTVTVDPCPG